MRRDARARMSGPFKARSPEQDFPQRIATLGLCLPPLTYSLMCTKCI